MNPELHQYPLGMMPCCMGADIQRVCDGGIRPTLGQQRGNLELSSGKPVFVLQVREPSLSCAVGAPALFLKLAPQLPHLTQGFAQLTDKQLAIAPQIRKSRKKIVQAITGDSILAKHPRIVPFISLHGTDSGRWQVRTCDGAALTVSF